MKATASLHTPTQPWIDSFCWIHENYVSHVIPLSLHCEPNVCTPFQTHMLKPNDQCDNVVGRVIRSQGIDGSKRGPSQQPSLLAAT